MKNSDADDRAPRISLVVTGMDATGELFRESVSAAIAEDGQYSFLMSRPLRVRDSVLIEFSATRAGEKPRKIASRVISIHPGPDPAGPKEVHLQPEALLDRPMLAPDNAPPVPAKPAPPAEQRTPIITPPPAIETAGSPAAAPVAAKPAANVAPTAPPAQPASPPPPADAKAPLLDAVRANATDAMYRDVLKQLATDAHTISVELGRKLSKELAEHSASLAAGLSAEAQAQAKLIHARVDELQHLWGSLRATFEKEQGALEQAHAAKLHSLRHAGEGIVARASSELEKLRAGQEEERRTMEAHLQQRAWDSVNSMAREAEGKLESLAGAAAERASQSVTGLLEQHAQALRERTAGAQGQLLQLLTQLEAGIHRAESALQSLQAATEQAEAFGARLHPGGRTVSAVSAEEAASMAERIQQSIVAARAAFRQSLADVSKVLENSLQANKFAVSGEEAGHT